MITIVDRETAGLIEDRARFPLAIQQWERRRDDGTVEQRGVVIQAWSYAQRWRAEQAALIRQGPQAGQVDDWRRVVEEVRLGIVEPADLPAQTIEGWGHVVVEYIHEQIERLGPIPPAALATELARVAGGPPPEPTGHGAAGGSHGGVPAQER